MRILNRTDFLSLPSGTVFAKWDGSAKDISIKHGSCGSDFVYTSLSQPQYEGLDESSEVIAMEERMEKGEESPVIDYERASGRDGLFDEGQLFLVWSVYDAKELFHLLEVAMNSGRCGE